MVWSRKVFSKLHLSPPQDQQLQSLSQTEYNQQGALVQQDLTQPTVIQDALVSDAQLQSTLNQQVIFHYPFHLLPDLSF